MQKITPHLWFDKEAMEAVEFYTSIFGDSSIETKAYYGKAGKEIHGQEEGQLMTVDFKLFGQDFIALNAGPIFKFNTSISFFVNFDPSRDNNAKENLQKLWDNLSAGGSVLMELNEYPFSKYYGWIQDKYGVSWQLILTDPAGDPRPVIVPSLLFTGDKSGRAEEAVDFYLSVFKNSKKGRVSPYQEGQSKNKNAKTAYADFMIENVCFAAMDSGVEQDMAFNEAISLLVRCEDQKEIDYYWEKLSSDSSAEQCGWLKDKFGVSWQIVPASMDEFMTTSDQAKKDKVMNVFLKMKKINIAELEAAGE